MASQITRAPAHLVCDLASLCFRKSVPLDNQKVARVPFFGIVRVSHAWVLGSNPVHCFASEV